MMKVIIVKRTVLYLVIALQVCGGLGAIGVMAHPLGEVVQKTYIWLGQEQILIDYETTIGPSISQSLKPDANQDGRVSLEEEQALIEQIAGTVSANLEIRLDRSRLEPEFFGGVVEFYKDGQRINGLEARLQFSLDPGKSGLERRELSFRDNNFLDGELSSLNYFVPVVRRILQTDIMEKGRTLSLKYLNQPGEKSNSAGSAPASAESDAAPRQMAADPVWLLLPGLGGFLCVLLASLMLIPPLSLKLNLTGGRSVRRLAWLFMAGGLSALGGALWMDLGA